MTLGAAPGVKVEGRKSIAEEKLVFGRPRPTRFQMVSPYEAARRQAQSWGVFAPGAPAHAAPSEP